MLTCHFFIFSYNIRKHTQMTLIRLRSFERLPVSPRLLVREWPRRRQWGLHKAFSWYHSHCRVSARYHFVLISIGIVVQVLRPGNWLSCRKATTSWESCLVPSTNRRSATSNTASWRPTWRCSFPTRPNWRPSSRKACSTGETRNTGRRWHQKMGVVPGRHLAGGLTLMIGAAKSRNSQDTGNPVMHSRRRIGTRELFYYTVNFA